MIPQTGTIRDVLLTAFICAFVGRCRHHRQERRHEREIRQRDEAWRLTWWEHQEAAPPPGHPDWWTTLSGDEEDALDRIEARWDHGLGILSSDEGAA